MTEALQMRTVWRTTTILPLVHIRSQSRQPRLRPDIKVLQSHISVQLKQCHKPKDIAVFHQPHNLYHDLRHDLMSRAPIDINAQIRSIDSLRYRMLAEEYSMHTAKTTKSGFSVRGPPAYTVSHFCVERTSLNMPEPRPD